MRAVIQRVKRAGVKIEGTPKASIGRGLLVLVGVEKGDDTKDVEYTASKILNLRVFEDESGRMNLSLKDIKGELLVISQFTLSGDIRKGRRPSFDMAEEPERAKELYEELLRALKTGPVPVKEGEFQAHMEVELVNDGPVTLLLDSRKIF